MSAKHPSRLGLLLAVGLFLSTACALPLMAQAPTPAPTPINSQTQAVQTIEAMMTQVAGGFTTPDALPSPVPPTATPAAIEPTLRPSSTPIPTATTVVLPQVTPTSACDQAGFVSDVSVPDGSTFPTGSGIRKTWRLKNNGTCAWTTDYTIVFDKGDQMKGPDSQKLEKAVQPGETVDITVDLVAPATPGTYRGHWKLRNASGVIFGVGSRSQTFYVDIKVISPTPIGSSSGFDFASNYCLATWTGNDKTLPCAGADGDSNGFVLFRDKPVLETGYIDDEPSLVTNPPLVNDSVIRGKYPPFVVRTGDHFKALLTCEHNAKNCNVRFQLEYQIDNGTVTTLKSWQETNDGVYTQVDEDLSSLDGKSVTFILTVYANGASDGDRAMWVSPRITRAQ